METPTKPGFYFAKSGSCEWHNLIVEVYGESPFFRLRGWDRTVDKLFQIEPSFIGQWGPEIEAPEPIR